MNTKLQVSNLEVETKFCRFRENSVDIPYSVITQTKENATLKYHISPSNPNFLRLAKDAIMLQGCAKLQHHQHGITKQQKTKQQIKVVSIIKLFQS